jgi:hypothetical protein
MQEPSFLRAQPGIPGTYPIGRTMVIPGGRAYGIILSVAFIVGIYFLGFGGVKVVNTAIFVRTSATTTGSITGFAYSRGTNGRSSTFAPEVRFRAPNGRLIRFRSQLSTNFTSYRTADEVGVRYDPADPHHAEIDAFMPLWGLGIILLLVGTLVTALGLGMLGRHRKALDALSGEPGWRSEVPGEQMSCPNCGFRQPRSDVCKVCRCDIALQQTRIVKARGFAEAVAPVRMALAILVPIVSIATFAYKWQSLSAGHSHRDVPIPWSDSVHHYEFSIPVDWHGHSTKDVVSSFPMLQSEPPVMFQLVATMKNPSDAVFALGVSGITREHILSVGWDGVASRIGSSNRIVFSDTVEFNGLTVHRVGYEAPGGYREDAYFEATDQVILVCFAVPKGVGNSEQVAHTRSVIMSNLSGT